MIKVFKFVVVATALAFSGMALASHSTDTLPQDSLVKQLQLTPEQVQQVKSLRKNTEQEIGKINTDALKQDAIIDMFSSGMWNDAEAKKQLDALGDIQNQVRFQRAKYLFQVSQILSREQKQHLQQILIEKQLY
jgi:Spy/CpxP family protein refolding chaperone